MSKWVLFTGVIILSTNHLLGDIGHFDIYKIIWQERVCFITLASPGLLKDNDLCYYDRSGNYRMEVNDYIDKQLKNNVKVFMYTDIEKILVDSLRRSDGTFAELASPIYVLKGWSPMVADSIRGQYELISASKGHTFGTESSQTVTEEDNKWIHKRTMKNIFSVGNGECTYNFYSSDIEPGSRPAVNLKNELQGLMPKGDDGLDLELNTEREKQFRRRVEELVKEKIFMLGGCSC
ncbi:hypothetical protein [Lewinella cohaerens]|uniref:hypothetical protein n=1 Tax=Lewinella cohaerens TaxID=70995 RepID=UPI000360038E|nr:hypothetical protein [Lewinella cohaerens]